MLESNRFRLTVSDSGSPATQSADRARADLKYVRPHGGGLQPTWISCGLPRRVISVPRPGGMDDARTDPIVNPSSGFPLISSVMEPASRNPLSSGSNKARAPPPLPPATSQG